MTYSYLSSIHHLPQHATPFIGRESEIADVVAYLDNPDCHLLTLTGFGGIGKTRLAIEAVKHFVETHRIHKKTFPDGIIFVELAPLSSSDLLADTIADRLGISVSKTTTIREQLPAELEYKTLLLILDNFEHIIDGKQLLNDILVVAQGVTILVTSREQLNLQEEHIYEVNGMSVPQDDTVQDVDSYSALLLFQHIAQRVDWRFTLDSEQVSYAIHICRLVDGIPLAIEMAAAWVRAFSCREIAGDLTNNFELLEDTLGYAPTRHRSIRVVFDYSWNLLSKADRVVYQKMSVFRGGFRRDAAEKITGATRHSLISLLDKSLLQHETNERYQIHELLRQFIGEELAQNPKNADNTHDLHCNYYASFLDKSEMELTAREDYHSPVLTKIDEDLDNVRSMWNWAIEHQHFAVIARASNNLYHYHQLNFTYGEAIAIFQKALTLVETAEPFADQEKLLTKLLAMLAINQGSYGFYDLAEKNANRGLLLSRRLNAHRAEARCLVTLGTLAVTRGMYPEAQHYLEAGTEIYETLGDTYESSFPIFVLGSSYLHVGEYDRARRHYEHLKSTGIKRNADGQVAWALTNLGYLDNILGHFDKAQKQGLESVEIFTRMKYPAGIIAASKNLANSYCGLGQYTGARYHFYTALKTYINHGSRLNELAVNTLAGIANLLALEGDVARALELVSFIQQHPRTNAETMELAGKLLNELEAELMPIVVESARIRGTTLELESLVENFIREFDPAYMDASSQTETADEYEPQLLQEMIEGLVSGEIFDENRSPKQQSDLQTLVGTLDTVLEKEKAKIMSAFMESASHDLRTPLSIINTSLYLLERVSEPDKQKDRIKLIKKQVSHLQLLIDNLISMARLDSGINLQIQRLDLNQMLSTIQQEQITEAIADRDLSIHFVLSDDPVIVQADNSKMQQALFNIIKNAIHYTPDGGTIWIEIHLETLDAIIEVRDTGIGIESDDLPHIFERFYRADKARTERGRFGLGLAIARKIIEAHNGRIDVVSTPGSGSSFRVILPLAST